MRYTMSKLPWPAADRRVLAVALSGAIHLAALAALLFWQFAPASDPAGPAITVVDLPDPALPEDPPPQPAPEPSPQPTRGAMKADAPAPPAPKAEAAPLARAIPVTLPTFAPAPVPSTGVLPNSGAASAGTGSGAGGEGRGSGGGGNGSGGGEPPVAPRLGTRPQIIRGGFRESDYPKELRAQRPEGTTWAEVIVGTNGRVTECRISRPSGIPQFDAKTCQILFQRFRYRPARDLAGRPVPAPDSFSVDWDYVDLNEE